MKNEIVGLPVDMLLDLPEISLSGNSRLELTNHKGLKDYTEKSITVLTKIGNLTVEGNNLFIKQISLDGIILEGTIIKLYYTYTQRRSD